MREITPRFLKNSLEKSLQEQVYIFSPHFYTTLSSVVGSEEQKEVERYEKVRRWTNGVEIFRKKFLLVPVNEACVPILKWLFLRLS